MATKIDSFSDVILSVIESSYDSSKVVLIGEKSSYAVDSEKVSDELRAAIAAKPISCKIRTTTREVGDDYKDKDGKARKVGFSETGVKLGDATHQVTVNLVCKDISMLDKAREAKELADIMGIAVVTAMNILYPGTIPA